MACISQEWCHWCKKNQQFLNGKCRPCSERENREKWILWDSLSVDDKLNKLLERIEKLETGPPRY